MLIITLQAAALLIVMHAMQSHRQADWQSGELDSGATQHATGNLPISASQANDQIWPEARSNAACCPETADDNAAAQAGPVPVSNMVETQAAKQLLGPAVSHAKSYQQLADPSPTGQPHVFNDRSIQLAGGVLSSARPPPVRSARSPMADEIHDTMCNCERQYAATLLLLLVNSAIAHLNWLFKQHSRQGSFLESAFLFACLHLILIHRISTASTVLHAFCLMP